MDNQEPSHEGWTHQDDAPAGVSEVLQAVSRRHDPHATQVWPGQESEGRGLKRPRQGRTPAPAADVRNRRVWGTVLIGLYALASPLFFGYFMALAMASDPCGSGSDEGICSARTQNFVTALFFGGILVGFACAVSTLSGARRASPAWWWTVFTLAVLSPLVCTTVALEVASYH